MTPQEITELLEKYILIVSAANLELPHAEQIYALDWFRLESSNINDLLNQCIKEESHIDLCLKLSSIIWHFWIQNGNIDVGYSILNQLFLLITGKIKKGDVFSQWHLAHMHLGIGALAFNLGFDIKAEESYKESLNIGKQLNNKIIQANSLRNIGEIFLNKGVAQDIDKKNGFEIALEYFNKSLNIFVEINSFDGMKSCNKGISIIYHRLGNNEKALDLLYTLLSEAEKSNNVMEMADLYSDIANILQEDSSQYEKADLFYKKSLINAQKIKDAKRESAAWNNRSSLAYRRNDAIHARDFSQFAVNLYRELKMKPQEGYALINLGSSYILLCEYKNAFKNLKKSLELVGINNLEGHVIAIDEMVVLFMKMENYGIALSFIVMSIKFRKETGIEYLTPEEKLFDGYIELIKTKITIQDFEENAKKGNELNFFDILFFLKPLDKLF